MDPGFGYSLPVTDHTPEPRQLSGGRRFELHERIGVGAFGEVYLATVKSTAGFSRKVALKLLRGGSPTLAARREARSLRAEQGWESPAPASTYTADRAPLRVVKA